MLRRRKWKRWWRDLERGTSHLPGGSRPRMAYALQAEIRPASRGWRAGLSVIVHRALLERSLSNPALPDGTSWTAGRFPTRQAFGAPAAGGAGLPHAQDRGGVGAGPSWGGGPDDQSCGGAVGL